MRKALWLVLLLFPRLAAAQAHLVKDLATGPASPYGSSSNPFLMKAVGATLYFAATTLDFGTELWKTDGPAASGAATVRPRERISLSIRWSSITSSGRSSRSMAASPSPQRESFGSPMGRPRERGASAAASSSSET